MLIILITIGLGKQTTNQLIWSSNLICELMCDNIPWTPCLTSQVFTRHTNDILDVIYTVCLPKLPPPLLYPIKHLGPVVSWREILILTAQTISEGPDHQIKKQCTKWIYMWWQVVWCVYLARGGSKRLCSVTVVMIGRPWWYAWKYENS